MKDSGYHSEEWEETDPEEDWPVLQPAVVEDGITLEEERREKSLSLCTYERWWRSSAVCIFIILLFLFINSFQKYINRIIYLFKLQRLLHDRIDPTVEQLRKKQPTLKQKQIHSDKTTSVPPIGAPSWCLNREALRKFNRSIENIPIYDYDTDEEDIQDQDQDHNDNNNEVNNSSKRKKRKTKKSKEKNQKKSKKN